MRRYTLRFVSLCPTCWRALNRIQLWTELPRFTHYVTNTSGSRTSSHWSIVIDEKYSALTSGTPDDFWRMQVRRVMEGQSESVCVRSFLFNGFHVVLLGSNRPACEPFGTFWECKNITRSDGRTKLRIYDQNGWGETYHIVSFNFWGRATGVANNTFQTVAFGISIERHYHGRCHWHERGSERDGQNVWTQAVSLTLPQACL